MKQVMNFQWVCLCGAALWFAGCGSDGVSRAPAGSSTTVLGGMPASTNTMPAVMPTPTSNTTCGDGQVMAPEQCDDGNQADDDACRQNCTIARCGDGVRRRDLGQGMPGYEYCDDGNTASGDGCSLSCALELGWSCAPEAGTMRSVCTPTCGDGQVVGAEQCDDGNTADGDGCSSTCQVEMLCGNGIVDDGEECDETVPDCTMCRVQAQDVTRSGQFNGRFQSKSFDRFVFTLAVENIVALNVVGPNGICPGDLTLELYIRNGANLGSLIASDDNGGVGLCPSLQQTLPQGTYEVVIREATDGAISDYQLDVKYGGTCGNGVVNVGEDCDGNSQANCDANCKLPSECGNGVTETGEDCDDGQRLNRDGCDRTCGSERYTLIRGVEQVEAGFAPGSLDVFQFVADGKSRLVTKTSDGMGRCPMQADTVMTLYQITDDNGRVVVTDNDDAAAGQGFGTCSALNIEIEAGVYEIEVTDRFGGQAIPDYVLDYALYQDVTGGGRYHGAFVARGDDHYQLNLTLAQQRVQISTLDLRGQCAGDTHLVLLRKTDMGFERVAENDNFNDSPCSTIEFDDLARGEYRIVVSGVDEVAIAPYRLFVGLPGQCGDGTINLDEECDDGNANGNDGCSAACLVEPGCGNGIVDSGEACDDGNDVTTDGCIECQLARCGDGFVQADVEACDDENADDGDACTNGCELARCGDGIVHVGTEDCDDGDGDDRAQRDFCAADCTIVNGCGNLRVDDGEQCDDGNEVDNDACTNACNNARCGDGIVGPNEECDDGNESDEDACTNACLNAVCGDGIVGPNEACDDGNENDADACTNACTNATCGDGIVGPNEQCDDGDRDDTNACTNMCQNARCGDGIVGPDEACDDGDDENTNACTNACEVARCGDEFVQGDEECDDGNQDDTDECTSMCRRAACGDGFTQRGEECDDGNDNDGDECTNACFNATCGDATTGPDEDCDDGNEDDSDFCTNQCLFATCGDGIVFIDPDAEGGMGGDSSEECDDGNQEDGDGCSAQCVLEGLCGNGTVDEPSEDCDDGNFNDGDGCDRLCTQEAYVLNQGRVNQRAAIALGTVDTFTFTVDDDQTVLFVETGDVDGQCPAGVDTNMTLQGPDPNQSDNRENDENLCAGLNIALSPGDYTLAVNEVDDDADIAEYYLFFSLFQNIGVLGGEFKGSIRSAGEGNDVRAGDDRYKIIGDGSSTFTLTVKAREDGGSCPGAVAFAVYKIADNSNRLVDAAMPVQEADVADCTPYSIVGLAGPHEVRVRGTDAAANFEYLLEVTVTQ
ncbi:MAG: DUF4215 domain-containing protein [Myxococcota bacterium]|nr:DUF4215 domain-containing protein [Myxococcota bacterium]